MNNTSLYETASPPPLCHYLNYSISQNLAITSRTYCEICMSSATTCATTEASTTNAFAWGHARLNHAAENFYYQLGLWVARHTTWTLLMSTALVILCCTGFINFSTETEGDIIKVCLGLYIVDLKEARSPGRCCEAGQRQTRSTET